jgi:hypothetical protein
MAGVVVCVKAHDSPIHGGEVPVGSRWDADSPVVAANPRKFKVEGSE